MDDNLHPFSSAAILEQILEQCGFDETIRIEHIPTTHFLRIPYSKLVFPGVYGAGVDRIAAERIGRAVRNRFCDHIEQLFQNKVIGNSDHRSKDYRMGKDFWLLQKVPKGREVITLEKVYRPDVFRDVADLIVHLDLLVAPKCQQPITLQARICPETGNLLPGSTYFQKDNWEPV